VFWKLFSNVQSSQSINCQHLFQNFSNRFNLPSYFCMKSFCDLQLATLLAFEKWLMDWQCCLTVSLNVYAACVDDVRSGLPYTFAGAFELVSDNERSILIFTRCYATASPLSHRRLHRGFSSACERSTDEAEAAKQLEESLMSLCLIT
jgi:hypothetical protein